MPHKEIIEYNGEKIEVITFDTEVHPTKSVAKQLKEIEALMDEEEKYQRDGKLTS